MFQTLTKYLLARAQERSTVAGIVAVAATALGVALPGDAIVNAVVGIAGVVAVLFPR